ncbi:hypothetical protein GCM10009116_21310 [Brevundimonas basaltis]|uniref:Uncharacterized protein n=1 Tax=Brevundimonas basaltis TaxID=472166 RepID=A0A7W8HZK2_9CAUL|nr:hypothetical protein [Brevundimonas basaltis]MBB5291880.1 hypothetical protein [Brevundimonas basaltis]
MTKAAKILEGLKVLAIASMGMLMLASPPALSQERYSVADWANTSWTDQSSGSTLDFIEFDGDIEITGVVKASGNNFDAWSGCGNVRFASDYSRFMVTYNGCGNAAYNSARLICVRRSQTTLECTNSMNTTAVRLTRK